MRFYLLHIIGDVEPVIRGPYKTGKLRDRAAKKLKERVGDEDGIFRLNIAQAVGDDMAYHFKDGLAVGVEAYSAGFFNQHCKVCRGKGRIPCDYCEGKNLDKEPCYECDSKGTVPCPECDGTGVMENDETG